jgi:hypothetical protein
MASRFLRAIPPGIIVERRTTSLWVPSWGVGQRGSGAAGQWARAGAQSSAGFDGPAAPPSTRPEGSRPAEEEASQDSPRYVKGERVRHRRFGGGTIQGLMGTGRDLKVSVAFDDAEVGVKQLLVAYAGLEREWESA